MNRPTSPAEAQRPGHRRTRVIAVANQKGGVGKSTTAVSLGAALAEMGRRVLVVDLDPQGNASTGLGIRHDQRKVTVYDVLATDAPIMEAVVQTSVPNLFGVPSTIDLAGAEIELVSQFSREMKLRRAMEPLRERGFDFVFLDCPPSLGLLTVNAMAAAEELIVPIQCEYYALEGLGQLIKNVRLVQQNVNPALRLSGIVMTMFDPRTKLSEQVVEEVRRYFGDRVYDTIIPRTVRLSEAPGFGQPITVYDPRSTGAKRYRELAGELIHKEPADEPVPVMDSLPSVILPPLEPVPMTAPRPMRSERSGESTELGALSETAGGGKGLAGEPSHEVGDEEEWSGLRMVGGSAGGGIGAGVGSEGSFGQVVGSAGPSEEVDNPIEATAPGGRDWAANEGVLPSKPEVEVQPNTGEQAKVEPPVEQPTDRPIDQPAEQQPEQAGAAGPAAERDVESSPGDEDLKRRWSLFRKGGRG
ncbi:MAG TPA: ParA family protein [Actinomycetota bacterium]|nr:ParA family protein [Actinomycetota bacterium]